MKILAALILLVLLAAAAAAGYVWYSIEKPYGTIPADGLYVDIPHGASRRAAAHILEKAGVIRNSFAFEFYARRHPKRTLEAGEYVFDHALSGKEVFWKLANGQVYEQPFTVREGETIFDIARDLEAAKYMSAEDFLKAAEDPSEIKDLFPEARSLEGFLFPATYNLPKHAPAQELTGMMVRKFREALANALPTGGAEGDPPCAVDRFRGYPGFTGGTRNAEAGRAAVGGGRLHEPVGEEHSAAVRPDRDLRAADGRRVQRHA